MRTLLITALLLLTLTACAGKEAPVEPTAKDAASADMAIVDAILIDPVGSVKLADGSIREITKLKKMGKFYIYISGRLNGRTSTVMRLTRLDDIKQWKAISFQDNDTIVIHNRANREFRFTEARIFIGSDSEETYTFISAQPGEYSNEELTVPKESVKLIVFTEEKKKEY